MKLTEIIPDTHFVQFNLSDLLEQLGEDKVKTILSSFSCPRNLDVENFLKFKAIEFSKRGFSKTHLVYWTTENKSEKELIGYYTIASKVITIFCNALTLLHSDRIKETRRSVGDGKRR